MSAPERRTQVLDSACELFARKGFAGTTSRELARVAGVSEAMLFKLFGDKRGFYDALLRHKIEEASEAIFRGQAAAAGDDRKFFSAMFREAFARVEKDDTFVRLLLYSALEGNDLAQMFYKNYSSRLLASVSDYIRRRQREGVFRQTDPEMAAFQALALVHQWILARHVFRLKPFLKRPSGEALEAFVDLILNGLRREGKR